MIQKTKTVNEKAYSDGEGDCEPAGLDDGLLFTMPCGLLLETAG